MTDIKTLALKYGGYTSLDKVYLDQLLASKTEQEQLALITPPPSALKLRPIILRKSVRN